MICSSKEINLLCTACNGLLTKISFCTKCFMPFHPHCLSKTCLKCKPKRISKINLKKLPTPSKNTINFDFFAPFFMSKCCLCKQNSVYFYNNFYCKECFIKICKNNFCSVCKQIFDENDFNSKMVRCDFCIKWIHLKCTELTDYQYGKMSLVGSNDEFCCKSCEKNLRKFKKMRNEPVVDNFFKCTVCKVGYLYDDPILVLYPYGTLFKHLNCTKLSNKCAVCNDISVTSVKCKFCTDSFHTLCSMGLFRQNNLVSMCNAHYHPTNHIKIASKFICSSIQNHKFIPGTFLFSRNVIYKPNEFIRLFFGDYKLKNENFIFPIKIKNELNVKVNFLSFNGDCFSFNGIKISISELKEMGICFKSEDVFKVSDKEFRSFVKFIDFLFFKRFCKVIKCDKFFFG